MKSENVIYYDTGPVLSFFIYSKDILKSISQISVYSIILNAKRNV